MIDSADFVHQFGDIYAGTSGSLLGGLPEFRCSVRWTCWLGRSLHLCRCANLLVCQHFSNDFNAIRTLESNFHALPTPVLRTFDVLGFCYQSGCLELRVCEAVRSELLKNREGLPKAFMNASFQDGLKNFSPRLQLQTEGICIEAGAATYSTPLSISKI